MSKKYFHLYRLGFWGFFNTVFAYLKKSLQLSLSKEQIAWIHHYNFILDYNLKHELWAQKDVTIFSPKYGKLVMRKFPTSDLACYKQLCVDNEYYHLIELVNEKLKRGKITMIDGGANIGLTSIVLKANLDPIYRIESILVEPFDENICQIRKNIELQKIDGFSILKAGITNKSGFLTLDYNFRDSLEWSVQIKTSLNTTDLIAIEICDILDQNKWEIVDILKLDIEGAEKDLFQDSNYAKIFLNRVRLVALEIHEEYISKDDVLGILFEAGFHMTSHGELYIGYNSKLV